MRSIRRFTAIALMSCALAAHAEKREFSYSVAAEVDTVGAVTSGDVLAEIDPAFESTIVGLVKQWKFKPAIRNGKAVTTRTTMWIKVVADIAEDQKARISARYVSHGNLYDAGVVPVYPRTAMRMRGEAEIVLEASFDANGVLTAIEPFQIKVSGGNKRLGEQFYAAAHDAVVRWKVRPEVVDGQPVASRQLIPIKFTMKPSKNRELETTLDRSTEALDDATRAAFADIDMAEQRSAMIGNATGLELIGDASSN